MPKKIEELTPFNFPLNGRLITKLDGSLLPEAHFQVLENLRYNDGGIEGVGGSVKAAAAFTGYAKIQNGFHFKKTSPIAEDHMFVQASSGTATRIYKSDGTSAGVPAVDTYTLFQALTDHSGGNHLNTVYFSEAPDQSMIFCDGYKNYVYSGTEYRAARVANFDIASSTVFQDCTEILSSNLSDASNIYTLVAAADTATYVYVGSTRPLDGVKFYVKTANTEAATACTGFYWNGTAWTTVGAVTDGTAAGGITLAQTGTVSFGSTVTTAKVKVIHENLAYWYYFKFSKTSATCALYQVTVSAPVQPLVDIWDGVPRQMYAAYYDQGAGYIDWILAGYSLDYVDTSVETYLKLTIADTNYLYVGFNERLAGLKFHLIGTHVNNNASDMTVYYWNGSAWTSVGILSDGTQVGAASFGQAGVVTWNDPGSTKEFKCSLGNSAEWFYYRIKFSVTLDEVYVDTVTGIPVQTTVPPYRYPMLWQNRLWLLDDTTNMRNTALGSSSGTVCVFNGTDSGRLVFGGMNNLTAGATLFTRYGGSLYENMVVTKNNETYLVDGLSFTGDASGANAYVVYKISSTRGCIAPLTMKSIDVGYEVAPGLTKHVLAWLASSGVVMFDSNSLIELSTDIGDKWDNKSTTYISTALSDKSAAFGDSTLGEYHVLLIPSGQTRPTVEMVYDVIRKKWFQIKRGTEILWCGWDVEDAQGNKYCYGGTNQGNVHLLESGTDFDGTDITYKFRLPDSLLNNSWATRKEMRQVKLIGVCKTLTTSKVTVTHYADGCTTESGPEATDITPNHAGFRFYKWARSVSFRGVTHSLEFSITTDNENSGFNPLYVTGLYKTIGLDVEAT